MQLRLFPALARKRSSANPSKIRCMLSYALLIISIMLRLYSNPLLNTLVERRQ